MKILSWNIARKLKALDCLQSMIEPDIALMQEFSPHGVERFSGSELLFKSIDERGRKEIWGNAIYSKFGIEEVVFPTDYKGALVAGFTELSNGDRVGLLNIYGLFEKVGEGKKQKLAWLGIHRMISDAGIWLGGYVGPKVKYMIVAGDFNNDRQMDTHPTFQRANRRPAGLLLDRFSDFGLVELLPHHFGEPVQTHRHVRSKFPWQIDHVFLNSTALKVIGSVEVQENEVIRNCSDHNPIIFNLKI